MLRSEKDKYFIGIPEGSIGTITKETPSEIAGFFTTDQQTCYVILAYGKGKEKGRLTFCHVNGHEDDRKILDLFDWAKKDNSERFIFITDDRTRNSLSMLTIKPAVSATVMNFLKSRKFKYRTYFQGRDGIFNEANFSFDRHGNVNPIDKYNLPIDNPYQHPMDYLYRFLINAFIKVFSSEQAFELDYVFDGNSYLKHEPYPKEWTDAINDCLEYSDDFDNLVFDSNKFRRMMQDHQEWFKGRENLLHLISSFLNETLKRFIPSSNSSIQELFEKIPKLNIALELGCGVMNL